MLGVLNGGDLSGCGGEIVFEYVRDRLLPLFLYVQADAQEVWPVFDDGETHVAQCHDDRHHSLGALAASAPPVQLCAYRELLVPLQSDHVVASLIHRRSSIRAVLGLLEALISHHAPYLSSL